MHRGCVCDCSRLALRARWIICHDAGRSDYLQGDRLAVGHFHSMSDKRWSAWQPAYDRDNREPKRERECGLLDGCWRAEHDGPRERCWDRVGFYNIARVGAWGGELLCHGPGGTYRLRRFRVGLGDQHSMSSITLAHRLSLCCSHHWCSCRHNKRSRECGRLCSHIGR